MNQRLSRAHRRIRVTGVAGAFAACLTAACSGTTDPFALFNTVTYTAQLHAINGSALGAPTAVNTGVATVVRADAAYDFDLGVDIDAQGRPVLLTQRAIGIPSGSGGHQVGLQPMAGTFDALDRAPDNGWVVDSVLTVSRGQVVAVRAGTPVCQFDVSPYVFSKLVVDSLDVPGRRVWLTLLTNPNCGFRSLQPGRPRN